METKVNLRAEFVTALASYPEWAMHRAFDRWVKEHTRRPSPGEIAILASRELEPITAELARRDKKQQAQLPAPDRVTPEAAARIMAEAGMTPDRLLAVKRFPMAGSLDEAKAKSAEWDAPKGHWSDTAAPDSAAWKQLQASRDANPLVHGPKVEAP